MAPSGPRGDMRNTRSSTRGSAKASGGGIRKSGGPRLDRNGDIIMGNDAAAKTPGGPGGSSTRKGSGSTRGGRGGARGTAAAEQKIRRHLGAVGEASLEKRISELPRKRAANMAARKMFRIVGLQASKAAANADRGEKSVLEFIERKSAKMGGSGIRVIKVCLMNVNSLEYLLHSRGPGLVLVLLLFTVSFKNIFMSSRAWSRLYLDYITKRLQPRSWPSLVVMTPS